MACAIDADCPASHCDTATGVCRECVDASHCASGWACEVGRCVSVRPECSSDDLCRPPSTICEGALCVAGCGAPGSAVVCGAGEVCDEATGRCFVDGGCRLDIECAPPDTVCERGACVAGCRTAGCGAEEICDDTTGRCEPKSTGNACTLDSECAPPITICEGGTCKRGCGRSGGPICADDELCADTGRCVARPSCSSDADCPAAAPLCEANVCQPGCDQAGGRTCVGDEVCDPGTGRCEIPRCSSDANCNGATPNCNLATGDCYACTEREDCTNAECDAATGACFSCSSDAQCSAPTPSCDITTGLCTGCKTDGECGGGTPVCDRGACRGCASNAECGNGQPPICNTQTGQCTGCTSNAECGGSTPVCHRPSSTCVACVSNVDCPSNAPVCDQATSSCTGCTSNADCGGNTPACHVPSGLCLGCVSNANCAAPTPTCNGATATCVGCATTGCPGGQTCNGATGQCDAPLGALGASCSSHADCVSNVCFDYGAGSRCTRSCGRTADCGGGFACHMFSGARMCIPPGSAPASAEAIDCTTDADCGGGNRCVWLEASPGRWDQRCRGSLGPGGAQASCLGYLDCANGICTVGVQSPNSRFCRQPCDFDGQCANGFFCAYVDFPGQSFVQAAKACVPLSSSFGACARDSQCAPNEVCRVIVYSMSGGLTYLYNGCAPRTN